MTEPLQETGPSRKEQLRDRIIDAAEEIIAARGLAALKAREAAARAGCSLGAIYTAFEDLDELILCIGARTLAQLEAALPAPQAGGCDLQRMALAYLAYARKEEPRWRALFEHRLPPEKPLPAWYAQERDRLFGLLETPLARLAPRERPEVLTQRARTLFSAVHGVVVLGLEEKLTPTPAQALEAQLTEFVATFRAGLMQRQASASLPGWP